jgi:DNA-directed RNA polymerase subunit M/transcription elongation factor TFIIS
MSLKLFQPVITVSSPSVPSINAPKVIRIVKTVESDLKSFINPGKEPLERLFGDEQIRTILSYKDKKGNIVFNNREFLFELIGLAIQITPDGVIDYINFLNGDYDNFIWNLPTLEGSRDAVRREATIIQTKEKGMKGIGRCGKCGGENIIYSQKTTRSADESDTVFYACLSCFHRWTG